ncbi:MAG: LemA family protein [Gammaproteobacteria bacterium]|nr:MAG: LemA family protein [Gammaproteobacteria bacterium]
MDTSTLIGLAVIGGLLIYGISIYNKLVALKNQFKNGFAQIDVQLQRRYDLIPNLVESAKAYLKHEQETLNQVVEARNQAAQLAKAADATDGDSVRKLARAESKVGQALANVYAVFEAYPDLKANQTISDLMSELSQTEDQISVARQVYNDAVMTYHTFMEQFPNNIIAGFFAFKPTELFEVETPEARKAVKVSFE